MIKKLTTVFALITAVGCSQQKFAVMGQEKQFGQSVSYNNKVDILWVVDNSNSMSQHQQKIAEQVSVFLSSLYNTGMDFHIGVTTMDCSSTGEKGRLVATPAGSPTVLTNSTPNLLSILQERLQMGDGGSSVERALEATQLALTEPLASGFNNGFRRLSSDHSSGAVLAVIYLSNEDDQSGSAVPNPKAFFDANSVAAAWGTPQWVVNFIGTTPDDPTCLTVPWTREDGLAYIALANQSGGGVSSICSGDFSTALTNVQGHILSMLTSQHLDRKPLKSSIKVYINGNFISEDAINGWTYDGDKTIYFHGSAIPPLGSNVKIDWLPEGFSQ